VDQPHPNRERLITFLHHDGVSWNNNLAENAIRRISNATGDKFRSAAWSLGPNAALAG
jgi:hypothetical protein